MVIIPQCWSRMKQDHCAINCFRSVQLFKTTNIFIKKGKSKLDKNDLFCALSNDSFKQKINSNDQSHVWAPLVSEQFSNENILMQAILDKYLFTLLSCGFQETSAGAQSSSCFGSCRSRWIWRGFGEKPDLLGSHIFQLIQLPTAPAHQVLNAHNLSPRDLCVLPELMLDLGKGPWLVFASP